MPLEQLSFTGETLLEATLERLRVFEPPDGYYLAFSGGKDSVVIKDLADRAGVKYDAHYNITGTDPPELVRFIKAHHPDVERHMPRTTLWRLLEKKGLPNRWRRWCCRELKERGGKGRLVITGVRWAESNRRAARNMTEHSHRTPSKRFIHVIIDWSTADVWSYIRGRGLAYCELYDQGFERLGCVMCPMATRRQTARELARWPRIAAAWYRGAARHYGAEDTPKVWAEWIKRLRGDEFPDPDQCLMFDQEGD